jgi:ABC-type sulfate/molybdate transport systems ATPase subunit
VTEAGRALLTCQGLSARRGPREVVRDVSLELRAGEVVALLGPNGAGKSTLLDALAGALPPTQGTVERNGRVAVALQAPDLVRRSVLVNVTLALAWWGVPRAERVDRALEGLTVMGARHLAERPAASLSGGERRRVHIARAIATQPDVLMLDEPFAGLDGEARTTLLEDAQQVLRSPNRATLVVVHDRAEAWALADRLLVLIDGELVASGPPQQVLDRPPSPTVARFLGYDGCIHVDGQELLTRPAHVTISPAGPLQARVTRATPVEDSMRLELELEDGHLYAISPLPAPGIGQDVRLRIDGGVTFSRAEAVDQTSGAPASRRGSSRNAAPDELSS